MNGDADPITPVETAAHVANLVLDLARGRFVPTPPALAAPESGTWANLQLDGYRCHLGFAGGSLTLTIQVPEEEFLVGPLFQMMRVRNQPARLNLADRTVVDAELAHLRRIGAKAHVDLDHWTWSTERVPELWVGTMVGALPSHGNLGLSERSGRHRHSSDGGFRLDGKFTWYLLRNSENDHHWVVLDAQGRVPTREELVREMMCLEFAFGTPFRLDYLLGLDRNREAVAACSLGHLVRHTQKHRSPVQDDLYGSHVWPPAFFHLLSTKVHAEGLYPLIIAIASYLDAEAEHLDGGYLKAQVGLEAFAKRLLGPGLSDELLVADGEQWKAWVNALLPEIKKRSLDKKGAEIIRDKFAKAMYAPTGILVKRALAERGVSLPRDVVEEVKKRNYSVHGFLMNAGLEHELDEDVRRLEIVQTLIAALVACHIGYAGPITGYDVQADGERPSPGWWPVSLNEEIASRRYLCRREIPDMALEHERIARRAYFRWLGNGGHHGNDVDDWLEAERALRAEAT